MEEQWKRVSEIEGLKDFTDYEVSTYGRIRSLKYKTPRILKPKLCRGYLIVILYNNKKESKTLRINRLVALAFIPNTDINKTQVNHIDENKLNNNIDNLEWTTPKENVNFGTRNKRSSITQGKKVFCLELKRIFNSTREVERELGLFHTNVSNCCNGKYKTCGKLHFYYIDIQEL